MKQRHKRKNQSYKTRILVNKKTRIREKGFGWTIGPCTDHRQYGTDVEKFVQELINERQNIF